MITQDKNKRIHTIKYYDKEKTTKEYERWTLNGENHREDGPACIGYNEDGSVWCEIYYINNKHHREDGPAWIEYCKDGSISYLEYCLNGEKHRKDGPAIIWYNEDGSIDALYYYLNGREFTEENYFKLISSKNRITVLFDDFDDNASSKEYYLDDKLHREDGPAVIVFLEDGSIWCENYYLNGKQYSKEEYLKLISPKNRIKVLFNDTE